MKHPYLLIFCLLLFQNAFGQETRKPLSENDKKLIEALKTDAEFQEIECWRERIEANKREMDIKLSAFEAFKLADRQSKIKRTCYTLEGDPVFSYLTIKDGKASVVIDTTQDPFGSKQVFSYQCSKLILAKYTEDLEARKKTFEEIEPAAIKEQMIVLQCRTESKEFTF